MPRLSAVGISGLQAGEDVKIQSMASGGLFTYALSIFQGTFTVVFRKPPFIIKPIRAVSDPDADEMYRVTINLITV